MKNKLERFVNEHRDAFDSEVPGRDVWSSINTDPAPQKSKLVSFFTRTRVAAAILIVANAMVIVFLLQRKPSATAPVAVAATEKPASNTEEASEQTLDLISKRVEVKQAALQEIRSTNPVLYKKFMEALGQLSTMYKDLEKEFAGSANKEALLEAMIQNLSLQQELLNQQLAIYQKVKQKKHEKSVKNI